MGMREKEERKLHPGVFWGDGVSDYSPDMKRSVWGQGGREWRHVVGL